MYPEGSAAGPMQHAFIEFDDRSHQPAAGREVVATAPAPSGRCRAAWRSACANGNTLGNYGTGGVIREITPDKQTVFHVKFDVADRQRRPTTRWSATTCLIDDLYALNGGGPPP